MVRLAPVSIEFVDHAVAALDLDLATVDHTALCNASTPSQ
jgi:hypothetical protein